MLKWCNDVDDLGGPQMTEETSNSHWNLLLFLFLRDLEAFVWFVFDWYNVRPPSYKLVYKPQ